MTDRFPLALRLLHWTMALLLLAMLFIGVAMVSTAGPAYASLLALHRPLGIAILLLAGIRLAIRLGSQTPRLPDDLPPFQAKAARGSHIRLYLAMIGLPLIGWGMLSAGGYPVRLTAGLVLPPVLPQDVLVFGVLRQAHALIAFAFFAMILGHLTIALVHGFVRRDGVLETMGFAKTTQPEPAEEDEAAQPEPEAQGAIRAPAEDPPAP